MLRFSEQPYVFKESRPLRWVYHLAMWSNRKLILPGKSQRVESIHVNGGDSLKELSRDPNVRLIFVANHSTHCDVEVLSEAQRRCGIWGGYMAAHDVFVRSKLQSWIMQRVGAFSVNRENVDRQSIKEAVKMVVGQRCCLSMFPEGNVAFTNEQVMPFLDGGAFIAMKAQKSLGNEVRVMVVPCSIRLTHKYDVRSTLRLQLKKLVECLLLEGIHVAVDFSDPFHRQIEVVGFAILKRGLERRGYEMPYDFETWSENPDGVLEDLVSGLLDVIGGEMEVEVKGGVEDRIRGLRSQLTKMRLEEGADLESILKWDDQTMLLLRVRSYAVGYLRDRPSVDRCAETLEKLREDFGEEIVRPVSNRHAEVLFGDPIEVSGKRVSGLTREMEESVSVGLASYGSPFPGGELMV